MLGKITLAISLALLLAEGCEKGQGKRDTPDGPQFNQASTENMCNLYSFATIAVNNPHQSKGTPSDMVGKVQVHCTKSLEVLLIEVKIQRRNDGGDWVDHTNVFPEVHTPAPERAKPYVGQAIARCPKDLLDTKFRTMGRADGVFEGRSAGMTQWKPSGEVTVKCS